MQETLFTDFKGSGEPDQYVDLVLPVPIPNLFTYLVPRELGASIGIGFRVVVQFGPKRVLTGIVARIHEKAPETYEVKPLLDVLDTEPVVHPIQIRFWSWMASYYACYLGEVMGAALPAGLKLNAESRLQLRPEFSREACAFPLDPREELLIQALEQKDSLTYLECEQVLGSKQIHKLIKSLIAKEIVLVFEQLKDRYTPRKVSKVRLAADYLEAGALEKLFETLSSKPKQEAVLLRLLQLLPVHQNPGLNALGVEKKRLREGVELSESSLNTLLKNGVLEGFEEIVSRFQEQEGTEQRPELSKAQAQALAEIGEAFQAKDTVLLQGVTGSGKTELYLHLILDALEGGAQVLLLLPEIALTTHLVERLRGALGAKMGVFHSKFSENERVEVWNGLLQGRYQVVVGVRSALFLPFDSLGLVIVDEEHESSFKQFDPAPRFQARDAALMLAHMHQAKTLLGSATPSFESYFHARREKYGYVFLGTRYGNAQLPQVELSDILRDKKRNLLKQGFTARLREAIQQRLARQEQVLLFQNRRGYAPYLFCDACGWVPECVQCDVNLTYHQAIASLNCHYCGFKDGLPAQCPACGSTKLSPVGLGTERLEEDVSLLFPEARVARMDLDTTRSKYGFQQLLEEFAAGHIDILVGTQMITKGLDFERVTLVGVMDADRILNFPDFRSSERAFAQLLQVGGRAGRREKAGEVIIQTRRPDQPLFQWVIGSDYHALYLEDMADRQKYLYPPFVKLIRVSVRHKEQPVAKKGAEHLRNLLQEVPVQKVVLGPEKALVGKVRNYYIFELLLKLERRQEANQEMKQALQQLAEGMQQQREFRNLRILIDVDPY
ncbi:MAG: replication restart helicase PriA [Nitritalea sp.]